jgi:hypothetical protein
MGIFEIRIVLVDYLIPEQNKSADKMRANLHLYSAGITLLRGGNTEDLYSSPGNSRKCLCGNTKNFVLIYVFKVIVYFIEHVQMNVQQEFRRG